jgi:hypothetical protein
MHSGSAEQDASTQTSDSPVSPQRQTRQQRAQPLALLHRPTRSNHLGSKPLLLPPLPAACLELAARLQRPQQPRRRPPRPATARILKTLRLAKAGRSVQRAHGRRSHGRIATASTRIHSEQHQPPRQTLRCPGTRRRFQHRAKCAQGHQSPLRQLLERSHLGRAATSCRLEYSSSLFRPTCAPCMRAGLGPKELRCLPEQKHLDHRRHKFVLHPKHLCATMALRHVGVEEAKHRSPPQHRAAACHLRCNQLELQRLANSHSILTAAEEQRREDVSVPVREKMSRLSAASATVGAPASAQTQSHRSRLLSGCGSLSCSEVAR